ERVHPGAALLQILTLALAARLAWGGLVRTWAGARLEEARVFVKPDVPVAGGTFAVRVSQTAKSGVTIDGWDVVLVAERTEIRTVGSRTKTKRTVLVRDLARIGEPMPLVPG